MLSATKIRLYPNLSQQELLATQFGCARWAWNEALTETQRLYRETGKGLSYIGMSQRLPKLKTENPWLSEASAQVLQQSLRNLAAAFQNFFERRARYPCYKSKHGRQSVHFPQNVSIKGDRIYLPKVGWVKCVVHRAIVGQMKTVTVSRSRCGHYYAAIRFEDGFEPLDPTMPTGGKFTGVDIGLIDYAVTGTGRHFANPRHMQRAETNLARKQRKLDRKRAGSKSKVKARQLVARAHERVANARKDYLHKLSRKLVDENQALAFEDLNVKGMQQHPKLAKAISDASWGMFLTYCQYKARRAGKFCVRTNRYFPSSKTCSICGKAVQTMRLDCRTWTCAGCGQIHDRDENAARNIGQEADRMLMAGVITASGIGAAANRGGVSHSRGRKSSLCASADEIRSSAA